MSESVEAPLFSVVVPTCDRPEMLWRCLDCLAPGRQTFPAARYEVIVTDDGRAPVSAEIARRYPWARWVAGPRRGPAANRNNGSREARGGWLAFTDDDCLPFPGWLSGFAALIETNRGAYALEGKVIADPPRDRHSDFVPVNLTGGCFWSCNIAIERARFSGLGGFDENYPGPSMEDVDLRTSLERSGVRIVFAPEAVINHPPRRLTVRTRIRHVQLLYSQVYFERKWRGRGPISLYFLMAGRVTHFWFMTPVRHGPNRLTAITYYLPAMVALTALFPLWYRRSEAAVSGRPIAASV